MSGRDFGLGFSFRVNDGGTQKYFAAVESGIDKLTESLASLDRGSRGNAFSNFISGMQLDRLNQMTSSMDDLVSKAGSGGSLTNSLTSTAMAIDKSFAQSFATLEGGGKAYRKLQKEVSSAVMGMNLDQGAAIKTAQAFASVFGKDAAKQFGFKSTGSMLKTFEVMQLDAGKTAEAFKKLTARSGFTEKGAMDLADQVFVLGQKFGVGTELTNAFIGNVTGVQDGLRDLGINGPKETEKAIQSVALLGGALVNTGMSADDAVSKSMEVFNKLTAESSSWSKAFAGVADGAPGELLQQLTMGLGSLDEAIATASADPAKMIQMMGTAMAELRKQGGPDAERRLVSLQKVAKDFGIPFEESGKSLLDFTKNFGPLDKVLEGASGALERAGAAAYRSGRSVDEALDLMKQGFENKLRGLVKNELFGPKGFVDRTRKAYKMVGNTISNLAKADGPVGDLTKRFIMFNQVGIRGLLGGGIGEFADTLIDASAKLLPAATALGALGFRFSNLLAPLKLLVSPLIATNALLGGLPGKLLSLSKWPLIVASGLVAIGAASGGAEGIFSGVIDYAKNKLPVDLLKATVGFDDKKFQQKYGMKVADMLARGGAWTIITDALTETWTKTVNFVVENFGKGVDISLNFGLKMAGLIEQGLDYLLTIDYAAGTKRLISMLSGKFTDALEAEGGKGGELVSKLGGILLKTWDLAVSVLGGVATGIWDKLASWWSNIPGGAMSKIKSIWEEHGASIGKVFVAALFFSSGVRTIAYNAIGLLLKGAVGIVGASVAGIGAAGAGAAGLAGGVTKMGVANAFGMGGFVGAQATPGAIPRDARGRITGPRGPGTSAFGTGVNNWKSGMGGRAAAGGIGGALVGGAMLGAKALSGKKITGEDVGSAVGIAAGAAIGAAFLGPMGALVGGALGEAAGSALGAIMDPKRIDTSASVVSGGIDATTAAFSKLRSRTADLVASSDRNIAMIRADTAVVSARSDTVARAIELEASMANARQAATDGLVENFKAIVTGGEKLSTLQVGELLPHMSSLAAMGKITAEQFSKFANDGFMDLTKEQIKTLGGEILKDTVYLSDERRRKYQELESKLAGIRLDAMEKELALTGKKLSIEGKLASAPSEKDAAVFDAFLAKQGDALNSSSVKAASAESLQAVMTNVFVGKEGKDIASKEQKKAREKVGQKYAEELKAAGIEIPKQVMDLINKGLDPTTDAFRNQVAGIAEDFDRAVLDRKALETELASLEHQGALDSLHGRQLELEATKGVADEMAKVQKGLEFGRLETALQAQSIETGSLRNEFNRATTAEAQDLVLEKARQQANIGRHADGGMINRPTLMSDAMTGKPFGLVGEAGQEEIVPKGAMAAAIAQQTAAIVNALRIEGEKTRAELKVKNRAPAGMTAAGLAGIR